MRQLTIVLAASVLAATLITAACGGGGTPSPATTVTVTASPTSSTSAKPKPTTKPAVKQQVIAVAAGTSANVLAVVTPAGKTKTVVVAKAGRISEISWSSDAARIAYAQMKSTSSATTNLWVYTVATGKAAPVLVSGAARNVAGYTWVAPTQLIVAVMTGSTTYHVNGQLYLCDVAKGTSSPVKDDSGKVVRGARPSASADFTHIAYVRYGPPKGSSQPESLMLYDADTLGVQKIATRSLATDFDNEAFAYPSISPDGSLVAGAQTGSDPGFSQSVYRIDGTPALTKTGLVWPAPVSWAKMSGRLAFGGAKGGSFENGSLFVYKPGGSAASLYTGTKHIVGASSWSPSGASIAFGLRSSSGDVSDLWTVKSSGGGAHLVMKNAGEPAWAEAAVPGL